MAKLEKLDPETRNDIYQMGFESCHWPDYLVQGVIQGAVAARRWHFDVCYNEETKKYVSLVAPPDNETWLDSIEAATPAEALLAAYTQALEAEVTR